MTSRLYPGHHGGIAGLLGDPRVDARRHWLGEANRFGRAGLNALVEACHGLSYAAGWWHDPGTAEPIEGSVAVKLALIHSEISEALEADRKGLLDDHLTDRPGIEVELADAIIRICDLAGALDLDLGGAVADKLMYNQHREDHRPDNRAAGGKAY